MGCEKACALMDKQKIIEDMTSHIQAGALPPNPNIDFLSNLPDHLKKSLGLVLGLSYDHPPVSDMWERMVAMGFLSVLTNLRLKPLRKIASEVSITVPSDQFTEKYCEALVFAAFPREKVRARILRARRKQVKFMVPQEKLTVKGDMGFISFQVNNISMLAREAERHYSPEFTYAGLKWSLLCMKNHESLALYLCQTGSVHCKFLITILNHSNPDDSICNEGTQSFSAVSHENDWGFNSVYKLSDLLNPAQGFYDPESDSITIEVGIVVVEPEKSDKPTKDKTPTAKSRKKKNEQAQHPEVEETYLQLLEEDAKEEEMKREMKKIKQELLKTVKEEEKTRKEIVQQSKKLFNDTMEKLKQEGKRIVKEIADREAKEEQEKQRQEEAIQQAIQKKEEVYQRLEQLRKESTKYTKEKDLLAKENKEVKKESNRLEQELKSIKGKMQSAEATVQQQKESISKAKKELEGMALESSPEPSTESDDANDDYDDDDFDGAVLISEGINKLIEEMAIEDD
ncbi:hypothetical protein AGDE_10395 [Angomonas deanei]|nr:hypothetical protein AGDE_10395 [Angomonas deanei]|eukprot:EPY28411.1 hypothetical protein AGDE_10395 [Angomonas deanei]